MRLGHIDRPSTVEEACRLLDRYPGARLMAGGTACVLMLQQGLIDPERLITLQALEGDERAAWSAIRVSRRKIRIGAGATLTEVADHPAVRRLLPSLAEAAGRVGNSRIRNIATLGGNLAESDYASDPPTVLACLGAECLVQSPTGTRTVPAAEFITGFYQNVLSNNEVLRELILPVPHRRQRSVYIKYVSRSSEDRPCVGVAATAHVYRGKVKNLRIVVGAVAPTPREIPKATSELEGRHVAEDDIALCARTYAESIQPLSDQRGTSTYRKQMIEVHVKRAITTLMGL